MVKKKDYCEICFTNAIILDIFGKYASNSEMAEIVSEDGSINVRFGLSDGNFEAPDNCEQTLSLLYALIESAPQSTIGRIYAENQHAILRETVYRISDVLDSFSDVKLVIHTFDTDNSDPAKEIEVQKKIILKRETKTVSITK